MPHVVRTQACDEDLLSIAVYIARDNLSAANTLIELFDQKFALLAEYPKLGRVRPELGRHARSMPVGNYLIIYRDLADRLEILRILHGARDLPATLGNIEDEPC